MHTLVFIQKETGSCNFEISCCHSAFLSCFASMYVLTSKVQPYLTKVHHYVIISAFIQPPTTLRATFEHMPHTYCRTIHLPTTTTTQRGECDVNVILKLLSCCSPVWNKIKYYMKWHTIVASANNRKCFITIFNTESIVFYRSTVVGVVIVGWCSEPPAMAKDNGGGLC